MEFGWLVERAITGWSAALLRQAVFQDSSSRWPWK